MTVKLLCFSEVAPVAQNISEQCALTLRKTCLLSKKLMEILINNEKIHNILGVYMAAYMRPLKDTCACKISWVL